MRLFEVSEVDDCVGEVVEVDDRGRAFYRCKVAESI